MKILWWHRCTNEEVEGTYKGRTTARDGWGNRLGDVRAIIKVVKCVECGKRRAFMITPDGDQQPMSIDWVDAYAPKMGD